MSERVTTTNVNIRLRPDEKRSLADAAKGKGMDISRFIRHKLGFKRRALNP